MTHKKEPAKDRALEHGVIQWYIDLADSVLDKKPPQEPSPEPPTEAPGKARI